MTKIANIAKIEPPPKFTATCIQYHLVQVFTDGSAEKALQNGGDGISSNYKAGVEARS